MTCVELQTCVGSLDWKLGRTVVKFADGGREREKKKKKSHNVLLYLPPRVRRHVSSAPRYVLFSAFRAVAVRIVPRIVRASLAKESALIQRQLLIARTESRGS